jgi:hypothetical protein
MTRPLSIAWREAPFGKIHYAAIESAERMPTIFELVSTLRNLPLGFMEAGEVELNGNVVSRKYWKQIRPKAGGLGETCLTLHMPIGDGGGAGSAKKNTVALVATIAVLLATAAVSGGALGPAGLAIAGSALAGGSASAAIAASAIGTGGMVSLSALGEPR